MNEVPLPDGISFFPPREKAPDFIIGAISVHPARFVTYLRDQKTNNAGYVQFDVKMSKKGRPYVELNTYKPDPLARLGGKDIANEKFVPEVFKSAIPCSKDSDMPDDFLKTAPEGF
ncbi:MAG: hypothetical protein AAB875_04460 [Patescibacteria group bacterium]